MACWTDLPLDVLAVIAQHFTVIEDFAAFSVVCQQCLLVTTMLKSKTSLPPRYPRFVLAENEHVPVCGFKNLLASTTAEVELPEARHRFCIGVRYGWLFTLGSDLQMNFLHPFSRQQISLPPMLTLPNQYEYNEKFTPQRIFRRFVGKIAISTSPLKRNNLNDECVVVAIYRQFSSLAYARIGDSVWTDIQVPFRGYKDVVYYKGKFYAVNWNGVVVACDIDDNNGPKATVVAPAPSSASPQTQMYLVESSGDLLLVFRVPKVFYDDEATDSDNSECEDDEDDEDDNDMDNEENNVGNPKYKEDPRFYSDAFSIWRLDECREERNDYAYKWEWTKLSTLGDRALFLGRNVSISKDSSDDIKANCIYFTDDYNKLYNPDQDGGGWDTGIFNIEDGKIEFDHRQESHSKIFPSFWYI